MGKRFTDTNKWNKHNFSELSLKMKLIWIYMCDNCDIAGIWDMNPKLIEFHFGEAITKAEINAAFGSKIRWLGELKLIIEPFVKFQYGTLSSNNRMHRSVLSRLDQVAPSKALRSPFKGDKDKDKDKDKDSSSLGECEGKTNLHWLASLWNELASPVLPRVERTNGVRLKRIEERVKERPDPEEWRLVISRINDSDFLAGRTDDKWTCSFDWLLQDHKESKVANHIRLFENMYSQKKGSASASVRYQQQFAEE